MNVKICSLPHEFGQRTGYELADMI